MKQVIAIYTTESRSINASRELVALATTEKERDTLVRRYLRGCIHERPTRDEVDDALAQIRQDGRTFCLGAACGFEIITEKYTVNTILG